MTWLRRGVPLLLLASCVGDIGDTYETEVPATSASNALDGSPKYAVDVSHWSGEITDAEVRCWWSRGVRHVIAGTQNLSIMRQQLDMAIDGGMTIDAYVYLYWGSNMGAQIQAALDALQGYPIGRLWLDAEENPGAHAPYQLESYLSDALTACGSTPCGIYTAKWWWNPATAGSKIFGNVPLWYAHYDDNPDLNSWSWQSFGGWTLPTAKQYNEIHVCGIDVDKNTMYVSAQPTKQPTPLPAAQPGPPPTPTGLYPRADVQILTESVRLLTLTAPGATQYAFEVQHYDGASFKPYYLFNSSTNARHFNPTFDNRVYRFRVRAHNASGWSGWSDWAQWEYGVASQWPSSGPPPNEPPPNEPPPDEPPPVGAPLNLAPPNGTVESGSVSLSCDPVSSASQYAFEIEMLDSSSQYVAYYTYTTTLPARTFYPTVKGTGYRWRVRAKTGNDWGPDSNWMTFIYP